MQASGSRGSTILKASIRQPRAARSCELCRLKKTKCDEGSPCTYCRTRNRECIYRTGDKQRRTVYSSDYVRQLERQVQALSAPRQPPHDVRFDSPSLSHDGLPSQFQSSHFVETIPNSKSRSTYQEDSSSLDALARAASSYSHEAAGAEVVARVNHTNSVERYENSSPKPPLCRAKRDIPPSARDQKINEKLDTSSATVENPEVLPGKSHYQRFRAFLNEFFGSIHYLHPFLDKHSFLLRCEKLWSNGPVSQPKSFMALYYSVLSLGALVGQRDEEFSGSVSNMEWSQILYDNARTLCNDLSLTVDLEMCQCFFFMAKTCQNMLNPHLSYFYTGLAVRTALALGINREPPPDSKKNPELLRAETRTWWTIYFFETEMSCGMGRPDTLGADIYHNRQYPKIQNEPPTDISDMLEPPQSAIIKCMVDLSRITRVICLGFYISSPTAEQNLNLAGQMEKELDAWFDKLPTSIRPPKTFERQKSLSKSIKDMLWMKRQRLILSIRYHNVRMLLFATFLTTAASIDQHNAGANRVNITKCLDSAKQTIEIIYETYRHNEFFRTWFYNTTYTLFAISVIAVYIVQNASKAERQHLFGYVEMSIEILEAMDDCTVAKKAGGMISRALVQMKNNAAGESATGIQQDTMMMRDTDLTTFNHYWGPLDLLNGEIDVTFPFELGHH